MSRFLPIKIVVVLLIAAGWARTADTLSVTSDGWTIRADGERGSLTINHDGLGAVMKEARLNLQRGHGLQQLNNWTVRRRSQDELWIKTAQPPSGWLFKLGPNTLRISSTSSVAVLSAQAPASANRIVARLLEPQGVPVDWAGTKEITSYGGHEIHNPSFLPTRNPECMYFALGRVSSSSFHSLFDRTVDMAIDFSEQTLMERNSQDPDLLDVIIPVLGNTVVRLIPDYFTKILGVPFYVPYDDSYFKTAPVAWNSWDRYYKDVTEEDIVGNTDWLARYLKPYGLKYVVLDEGYALGEKGRWLLSWNPAKFPHGPQWLASYIKSKGLQAGLWFCPNGNTHPGAVEEHPDWYVRLSDGKVAHDYGAAVLDATNPQALDFLREELTTLDEWGFDYYKFDGEWYAPKYMGNIDSDKLYNKSIDPLVAYRDRLKLIRNTIGPQRFIEACPAGTPLNGIGYFDSYFNGLDLYPSWQGMYPLFSSISANAFLNHIVAYVMPGEGINVEEPMSVEEAKKKREAFADALAHKITREDPITAFGAATAEARTLVTYLALTGVVYSVASKMSELPQERVKLLKMTLPTLPIFPIDLFSRGNKLVWETFMHTTTDDYIDTFPEILDLKVNASSGVYDVVGMTNLRSWAVTRELSFKDKLGLNPHSSYAVFDFWNQKFCGVLKDQMKVEIEPHDTRVLLIHPALTRPQLIGLSRHITGAYSILDLKWEPAKNILRGSSQTMPGETYSLWVYVPDGVRLSLVRATASGQHEVPVHQKLVGNSLEVSFQGQQEVINWEVGFAANAPK